MKRREFIAGLGSAAAWPLAARAQQPAMPVIGVLLPQSAGEYKIEIAAFLQTLKEAGFVAGQNVAVEYRYADNHNDRLPAFAADFVRHATGSPPPE
jgi:putative tryptophan/tyrosine transport system substrate-binding protein